MKLYEVLEPDSSLIIVGIFYSTVNRTHRKEKKCEWKMAKSTAATRNE